MSAALPVVARMTGGTYTARCAGHIASCTSCASFAAERAAAKAFAAIRGGKISTADIEITEVSYIRALSDLGSDIGCDRRWYYKASLKPAVGCGMRKGRQLRRGIRPAPTPLRMRRVDGSAAIAGLVALALVVVLAWIFGALIFAQGLQLQMAAATVLAWLGAAMGVAAIILCGIMLARDQPSPPGGRR